MPIVHMKVNMYNLLLFFLTSYSCALAMDKPHYDIDRAEELFNNFITEHNKTYKTEAEKEYRFEIFKMNLEKVNILNKDDHYTAYGITPFMDVTVEEVIKTRTGLRNHSRNYSKILTDDDVKYDSDIPEEFDWRDKGVVTRVKDQGNCGASYAFSAIGQVESAYAIKHNKTLELSEQQLIDCGVLTNGCCATDLYLVFSELVRLNKRLCMLDKDYPYKQKKNYCRCTFANHCVSEARVLSYKWHLLNTQEGVKQLLYHTGPISIGINADYLHTYQHGIISDDHCSRDPNVNHAVLLVGYGIENNIPYWIVKNSWGEKFGEAGYFRMRRGENALSCGMMTAAMYSIVVL